MTDQLTFRLLARSDFVRLARWLTEPLVARWWNHETGPDALERDFGAGIDRRDPVEVYIASLAEEPFGLIQRYDLDGEPEFLAELRSVCEVPAGALSMDYLIGVPALRGRGLAAAMISALIADSWTHYPRSSAVVVPVVAANVASWRTLERAGLRRIAQGDLKPDNPIDGPAHFVYGIDRPPTVR